MTNAANSRTTVTTADGVVLLLTMVGFLRERDGVPVSELADRFNISEAEARRLVTFLGTAGVPGDTLSYQHEDLFDIDWDSLELRDEVRLTQVIAVDDAPRFAPAETAALIAGLQALTPMLPIADAARARALTDKLAAALGAASPVLSLQQEPADPRIALIIEALRDGHRIGFSYRDAAGSQTRREADPIAVSQHDGAWYLRAHCLTRGAERSFRIAQMSGLTVGAPAVTAAAAPAVAVAAAAAATAAAIEGQASADQTGRFELVARVPESSLAALAGFSPRVLEACGEGTVRIAIDAWHGALALQLMRVAPGRIVIESPAEARAAVHDWVSRALAAYDA